MPPIVVLAILIGLVECESRIIIVEKNPHWSEHLKPKEGITEPASQLSGCDSVLVVKYPEHGEVLLYSERGFLTIHCLTKEPLYHTVLLKKPEYPVCITESNFKVHESLKFKKTNSSCSLLATFTARRKTRLDGEKPWISLNCTHPGIPKRYLYSATWRKAGNGERCNIKTDCLVREQECVLRRGLTRCQCPASKPIFIDDENLPPGCFAASRPREPCVHKDQCLGPNSECIEKRCQCRGKQDGSICNSTSINAPNSAILLVLVCFFTLVHSASKASASKASASKASASKSGVTTVFLVCFSTLVYSEPQPTSSNSGCDNIRAERSSQKGILLPSEELKYEVHCERNTDKTSPWKTPLCPKCTAIKNNSKTKLNNVSKDGSCGVVATLSARENWIPEDGEPWQRFECSVPGYYSYSFQVKWKKSGNDGRCDLQTDCEVKEQECVRKKCACPDEKPLFIEHENPKCSEASRLGEYCFNKDQCLDSNSECIDHQCRCKDDFRQEGSMCNSGSTTGLKYTNFFYYILGPFYNLWSTLGPGV